MAAARPQPETIPAAIARRLFMGGKGLLDDPGRRAGPASVLRTIEQIGFVQVDTISVVERAHHHILLARLAGYQPHMLTRLLERDRRVFEHWTHDASIIPARWLPWWRVRFARYEARGHSANKWWKQRIGPNADAIIAHVLERITADGPLMSRDFEFDRKEGENGNWWGWKPQKVALEFLWRTGRLSVARRENFHKVYDLTERVFPELAHDEHVEEEAHLEWACRAALDRLGVATPAEIGQFLNAVKLPEAKRWCDEAVKRGELVPLLVEAVDGSNPRRAFAPPDWRKRASHLPDPFPGGRVLSPFDPIVRDRNRALRLFDFDYRFEAFVPGPKRKYGYYVLPILEGESFIARLDAKLHRSRGELEVLGFWWEPKVKRTPQRRRIAREAIERYAQAIGGERISMQRI